MPTTQSMEDFTANFGPVEDPDSLTSGWAWNVTQAFKPAIGIQLLPRMIDGEQTMRWVKTPNYSFRRGDLLFRSGKKLEWAIQVKSASPASTKKPGSVSCQIFEMRKGQWEESEMVSGTQKEMVRFLQFDDKSVFSGGRQ